MIDSISDPQAEAVRTAYQWAWGVQQNPKVGSVLLLCALRLCQLLEEHQGKPGAYEALQQCRLDWEDQSRRNKSPELRLAVDSLALILGIE